MCLSGCEEVIEIELFARSCRSRTRRIKLAPRAMQRINSFSATLMSLCLKSLFPRTRSDTETQRLQYLP